MDRALGFVEKQAEIRHPCCHVPQAEACRNTPYQRIDRQDLKIQQCRPHGKTLPELPLPPGFATDLAGCSEIDGCQEFRLERLCGLSKTCGEQQPRHRWHR
jgi:hypothetical protein